MNSKNTLGLQSHILPILKGATKQGLWNEVTVGVATKDDQQIIFHGNSRSVAESHGHERIYDIASLVKFLLHLVCHALFEGGNPRYAINGFTPKTRVVDIISGPHGQHFDKLTIGHLMRFLVRFKYSANLKFLAKEGFDAVISRIMIEGLEETPEEVWGYFNHTSLLLGHCLEIETGKPLYQIMQECLFDPVGANESTFFPKKLWTDEVIAARCAPTEGCAPGEVHDPASRAFLEQGKTCGVAGVFSPVRDLLKVGQMLLHDGAVGPEGNQTVLIPSARVSGLGRNTLPSGAHTAGGDPVEFGDGAGLLHMFCKGQRYKDHPIVVISPGTIHKLGHPGHVFFHCPADQVCVVICSDNIAKPEMSTQAKRKEFLYPTMTAILGAVINGLKSYRIAKVRG